MTKDYFKKATMKDFTSWDLSTKYVKRIAYLLAKSPQKFEKKS